MIYCICIYIFKLVNNDNFKAVPIVLHSYNLFLILKINKSDNGIYNIFTYLNLIFDQFKHTIILNAMLLHL